MFDKSIVKNIIRGIIFYILFMILPIALVVINYEAQSKIEEQYLKTVTVYEVHPLNEFVILEDESGNLWMIDPENEEFKVKEVCSVLFNSMGTEDIEDDEIVLIQKSEITIN